MSGDAQAGSDRRSRLFFAGLALLLVLGLALGAASLDEVNLSSAGGTSGYDADEPIEVGDTQRAPQRTEAEQSGELTVWFFLSVYLLGALATVALAWHRDIQTVWLAMAVMIVLFVFLTFLGGMDGYSFIGTNGSGEIDEVPNDTELGSGTGSEPNNVPPATAMPTAFLVFVGLLLGLGLLMGFSQSSSPDSEDEDEAATDAEAVASIGAAAGRAADHIEASTGDNPVYEAWRDMRTAIEDEEDPTLTPAEFRDRAIAAGIPPGPTDELTAVFREVRYGHEPPNDARVDAAQAALREVEAVAAELTAEEGQEGTDGAPGPADSPPPSTGSNDSNDSDESDESSGSAPGSDGSGVES